MRIRIILVATLIFLIFCALVGRLAYWQLSKASELKSQVYNQQVSNITINSKRGSIYDATGKLLATSVSTDTVSINPTDIEYSNGNKVESEVVARILSDSFELSYEDVLKKVSSNSTYETIIRKVEKDKIDAFELILKDKKITSGINIDDDTKRYYPYNTVLSNVLGFVGTDSRNRRN
jgi:stage V sporulation protein D (sporulation-specific penicillin-binding protein)